MDYYYLNQRNRVRFENDAKYFEEEIQMNIDIEYFLVFGYYLMEAG